MHKVLLEVINCPFCNENVSTLWAQENGFTAVKCSFCGLIYVNPRPVASYIDDAVKKGIHGDNRNVIGKPRPAKVFFYRKIFLDIFTDVWASKRKVSWLDVGAGFGEIVETLISLAPPGSVIEGIEPMGPKVQLANKNGINIIEGYVHDINRTYEFVSLIDVYSHIPDFRSFLKDIVKVLDNKGELFIETGNTAELEHINQVPAELNLPDHLVFASEEIVCKILEDEGFSLVSIKRKRIDNFTFFLKNIIKKIIGKKAFLKLPYTSPYRTLLIRARLHNHKKSI